MKASSICATAPVAPELGVQLGLADEVDFTFLREGETLVVGERPVEGIGRVDITGQGIEGIITSDAHLDRVGCHGRGGHHSADDQGGRAE